MTDAVSGSQSTAEADKEAIDEKVVELINEAIVSTNDGEKVKSLQKVQSLVIHHNLIDNFLDEVIGFQSDKSEKVRRFVVEFIELSCKSDGDFFPKLIVNLKLLLNDGHVNVVKRTIQSLTSLIKPFLKWIVKSTITPDSEATTEAESALEEWNSIKLIICSLIETTENEGIKAQCIKFMESIVIVQTEPDQWSNVATGGAGDSNEEIQLFQSLANCRRFNATFMKDEAASVFDQLLTLLATAHISSVNLIACISSLVLIARTRSLLFMEKVINALVSLHADLPPTLSQSQVNSVQKHFKIQVSNLLKHPLAATTPNYQSSIIELLTDLGLGPSDVNKCLNEVRKRGIKVENVDVTVKRIKLDPNASTSSASGDHSRHHAQRQVSNEPQLKITRSEANGAIEITAMEIKSKLEIVDNVTDLVLVSLLTLPDTMPPNFAAEYLPLVNTQKTHEEVINFISQTLAHQWTSVGFGRGIEEVVKRYLPQNVTEEQAAKIVSEIASGIATELKKQEAVKMASRVSSSSKVRLIPTTGISSTAPVKVKSVNFVDITRELDQETNDKMILMAVERILNKEKDKHMFSKEQFETRNNILAHIASLYQDNSINPDSMAKVTDVIINYALSDLRGRSEILFSIIYNQYLIWKRSNDNADKVIYERTLLMVLKGIAAMSDRPTDRDNYLTRFFLESPFITENCIQFLKYFILIHSNQGSLGDSASTISISAGLNVIQSLVHKRNQLRPQLINCLNSLIVNTQSSEVRSASLKTIKYLHETYGADVKENIESFAISLLEKLTQPTPPKEIFSPDNNLTMAVDGDSGHGTSQKITWDEESMKMCLIPFLQLLPASHKLIHKLALVYVASSDNVKRVILRLLESPVKGMGMSSPELLLLVENCPKEAGTLVARIIDVLTERVVPSQELVSRVRDLYQKRVSDVRFLIPVLNGLSKEEVIKILPNLIKSNPMVVKKAFDRLLGVHQHAIDGTGGNQFRSPLTPQDLLIALHDIDEKKCDMETVMKATTLCFNLKNIYTQETLVIVINKLIEKKDLPVLFMRTLIRTRTLYPRLQSFTVTILRGLILRKVWSMKKQIWVGFIRCIQITIPDSYDVLLKLPLEQLKNAFKIQDPDRNKKPLGPELKRSLQEYLNTLSLEQRSYVVTEDKWKVISAIEEPKVPMEVTGSGNGEVGNQENVAEKMDFQES